MFSVYPEHWHDPPLPASGSSNGMQELTGMTVVYTPVGDPTPAPVRDVIEGKVVVGVSNAD
jgi:hypothetical protein